MFCQQTGCDMDRCTLNKVNLCFSCQSGWREGLLYEIVLVLSEQGWRWETRTSLGYLNQERPSAQLINTLNIYNTTYYYVRNVLKNVLLRPCATRPYLKPSD